jgi:SAM-dependent methyltransferase
MIPSEQPATVEGMRLHEELLAWLPALRCPECKRVGLVADGRGLRCGACGAVYEPSGGIPACCSVETRQLSFVTDLDVVDPDGRDADDVTRANAVYHNCAAATYEEDNAAVRTITATGDERIRELLRWLKNEGASGPLLDFGTGTGHILGLAEGIYEPRLGLDISGGMLTRAAARNRQVLLADCSDPPVADGSVGITVAYSFLHLFKEPTEILDQLLRVLRPGGWLMVDWEPNTYARPRILSRFVAWLAHPELWFRPRTYQKSEKVARVNALAEYHEALGSGLDAEKLAAHLAARGCDRVEIVYHSNAASALTPRIRVRERIRALLDARWPSAKRTGAMFLLFARRGSGEA